jgi:EAL domain-containing protein (putative c-di-GMP-specific phosphodiesterase class I)/GGDEF domain-containing protein
MQNQELNLTSADVFEQAVQQRIANAKESLSVFVVDMSDINRLFARSGQSVSTMFLSSIAKMLLRMCREGDTVSRIGDCTFGIVLDNVGSPVLQQLAAEKIVRVYKSVVSEMDASYEPGISIGIAAYPGSADSAVELLHNARIALESACSKGDPYQVSSPETHAVLATKWALQDDFAEAIENGALELVYQPKISISTGRPLGAEALLRWTHKEQGAVPPSVFVPIACDIGMIDKLTNFVLTTALRDTSEWPDIGERCSVSVNLEAQMLEYPDIADVIANNIAIWGNENVDLILEITELALVADSKSDFERLNQLRSLGIGISIDDFGTGYSSLSYFKDIPADELKVDRSFISNVQNCDRNRNLVATIISLAHRFGLTVVAEGVESAEELQVLEEMKCDAMQGFHYSEPLPHDELCRWLEQFSEATRQPDRENAR